MGVNAWENRHLLLKTSGDDLLGYPDSHQAWADRYQLLLDLAHGDDYARDLIKQEQLFRAFDDAGEVIGYTRAYYRDRMFVLSVAVSALAIGEVTLNPVEGIPEAEVERAKAIWKRSQPDDDWSMTLVAAGDLFLEPARADAGSDEVTIISHPPQNTVPVYGMVHRARLERVTVTSAVVDDPVVDYSGNVTEAATTYTHQRRLDRTEITVTATYPPDSEGEEQKQVDEKASGPHRLGAVPLVHVKCIPASYPEHSLPVTHGMDRGIMLADSLISQIKAVGDRFANPKPYLFGAKLGDDSAYSLFGRILNIFGGSGKQQIEAGYIEPTMTGIKELREQLAELLAEIRATLPEFLFNGKSTANISAEALQLLATQYERRYSAIRTRYYKALEKALAMGVALELRRPYDPDRHPVTIEGPALLPANIKLQLEAMQLAKDLGGLSVVDIVKGTQALGLADREVDAEDYAELVAEEQMGAAQALMGTDGPGAAAGTPNPRMLQAVVEQLRSALAQVPDEARDEVEEAIEAIEDAIDDMRDGGLLDEEE